MISALTIHPSAAANAYTRTQRSTEDTGTDFGTALQNTVQEAIASGNSAELKAAQAIAGKGDLTDVVTAIAQAQLTLQTATAIRDRVVQAYQDIMKMPI